MPFGFDAALCTDILEFDPLWLIEPLAIIFGIVNQPIAVLG